MLPMLWTRTVQWQFYPLCYRGAHNQKSKGEKGPAVLLHLPGRWQGCRHWSRTLSGDSSRSTLSSSKHLPMRIVHPDWWGAKLECRRTMWRRRKIMRKELLRRITRKRRSRRQRRLRRQHELGKHLIVFTIKIICTVYLFISFQRKMPTCHSREGEMRQLNASIPGP